MIRPVMCNQCDNPICVDVCPEEGATYKREEDGIVVIDKEICIGCFKCVDVCPYGSRYKIQSPDGYFGSELTPYELQAKQYSDVDMIDKCDFCLEYNGGEAPDPVCVMACPVVARHFGDLADLQGLISSRNGEVYMDEEGTSPNVYYLP